MPDETRSQDPPRDADPQRSPVTQPNSISEQNAEMRDGSNQNSNQSATQTKKLARELHWLEKANFAGQIILAVVGIVALVINRGKLRVMQGTLDQMRGRGKLQLSKCGVRRELQSGHGWVRALQNLPSLRLESQLR